MALDAGGARMRERSGPNQGPSFVLPSLTPGESAFVKEVDDALKRDRVLEASVTVEVTETHDGKACDCIDQKMTLRVGDELTLDHTCHDGRVDKVVAKVLSISPPLGPEHGGARVKGQA